MPDSYKEGKKPEPADPPPVVDDSGNDSSGNSSDDLGGGSSSDVGSITPIIGDPKAGLFKSFVSGLTWDFAYGDTFYDAKLRNIFGADIQDGADIRAYEQQAGLKLYVLNMLPGRVVKNSVKYVPKGLGDFAHNYQRSVGASQRVPNVLQTGGNKLSNRTAEGLNEQLGENLTKRDWGRALEGLKKDNGLRNDHHGRILDNGDYVNDAGDVLGNISDYLP